MDNITREDIINAICRTARENDGKPLGKKRFSDDTGIKPYDWKKYWARFGDAQREAGFIPNALNPKYSDEFLFNKIICLIRRLGRFPVHGELRIEKNNDAEFPHSKSFFDTKEQKLNLVTKLIEWCQRNNGYDDIIRLCSPILEEHKTKENFDGTNDTKFGEVYLFKSGRYYKIGKTNDTVRRGNEIRIQLPERTEMIRSIKTDDPSGIEAYWHRRFEIKRKNGEWFDLSSADIKAFKRWRRIF